MDFEHSERARQVMELVERFVDERIVPNHQTYRAELVGGADWTKWKVPPVIEALKQEAKGLGLWNLFLPDKEHGAGLDNRDYAPIAEITGRSFSQHRQAGARDGCVARDGSALDGALAGHRKCLAESRPTGTVLGAIH